ncbi:MAG: DUF4124 domain-containing protein [Betaproteobacteria bacterium]
MPASRLVAAAVLLAAAGIAHAQVFKCLDGSGRTTYQQEPCAKDERAARVDIQPDNGSTRESAALEAQWSAAARQGQVQAGMPRRFVRDAYGVPAEVRGGSSAERVSEIWIYRNPGGVRRVGFLDGRVAWDRGDDASSAPPAQDEAGDTTARRDGGPLASRRAIAGGRDCASVIAESGTPDRIENIQVAVAGRNGQSTLAPALRNVYDDDGGSPPRAVAFTCVNGIVHEVERPAR